jgi:hypothetical protein
MKKMLTIPEPFLILTKKTMNPSSAFANASADKSEKNH